jgi:hypothetical protein
MKLQVNINLACSTEKTSHGYFYSLGQIIKMVRSIPLKYTYPVIPKIQSIMTAIKYMFTETQLVHFNHS